MVDMTSGTSSFTCILGRVAFAAKYILSRRNKFQVFRITALSITAKVIDAEMRRDWSLEYLIGDSVGFVLASFKVDLSIAFLERTRKLNAPSFGWLD